MTLTAVLRAAPDLLSEQGTLSPSPHHRATSVSPPQWHSLILAHTYRLLPRVRGIIHTSSHLLLLHSPLLIWLLDVRQSLPWFLALALSSSCTVTTFFFFPSHLQALYSPAAVCSVWRQGWAFYPAHLLLLMQRHQRAGIRCHYSSCKGKHWSYTTMWMLQR